MLPTASNKHTTEPNVLRIVSTTAADEGPIPLNCRACMPTTSQLLPTVCIAALHFVWLVEGHQSRGTPSSD
jgi:hypothetical protein